MLKNLIEDKKAKTKSYLFKDESNIFDKKYISFLENFYFKNKKDVRICMHKGPNAKHHDMIILQQKRNFYKPHKHLKKGETYHIIKGSMVTLLFNENGKIKKISKLNKNNIFRTPINIFHTMIPLTKYVIYHESKNGPFLKNNDSIFPKWNNLNLEDYCRKKIKKYLTNA